MRIASERGGSKGGIPVSLQDASSSAARELLHHESGTAAGDVRHDGGAPMNLGDQSQIDGEGELHLLSLAQAEVFRFDEDAVCTQVFSLADPALATGHHHVHGRACAVSGVQATLHPSGSLCYSILGSSLCTLRCV